MKKFADWWGNNWHIATLGVLGVVLLVNLYQATVGHKIQVTQISQENPGCIYLESSRLGAGQHYMICNGQITLTRAHSAVDPEEVSQAAVDGAIAPEANASDAAVSTPAPTSK